MLPVKTGSLVLSAESKLKLDLFYRRFCTGTQGEIYGVSHIVYACHASFPLLISPELANLTWLNFNTYTNPEGLQKIDRIVVSDFLLSPLVRIVTYRQFEVIPEIRNYLLHLLKDSRWFNLFGIESFGDDRLNSLAQFLHQYLADKKSNIQNNAPGFKEVNEWAALSYLEPDLLTYKIAEAFKKTFSNDNSKPDDEHGQLRLNMLMDRFEQQIKLDIHGKEPDSSKSFINLYQYSKANKARLFEKEDSEVSDLFFQLDKSFIEEKGTGNALIELPVPKEIGERLDRKKNDIQRVFAVFIAIDEYEDINIGHSRGRVKGGQFFLDTLSKIAGKYKIDIRSTSIINKEATHSTILKQFDIHLKDSRKEDLIIVYLSGEFVSIENKNLFLVYDSSLKSTDSAISSEKLLSLLNDKQAIIVLDGRANALSWPMRNNIVMAATRDNGEESLAATFSGVYMCIFPYFLSEILLRINVRLTYRHLQNLLRNKIASLSDRSGYSPGQTPVFQAEKWNGLDYFFLSRKIAEPSTGFLLIYNETRGSWQVLDEDFKIVQTNTTAQVYRYESNSLIENVSGEIFVRDNNLWFGGKTDLLDKTQIYRVKPHKPTLYYDLEMNLGVKRIVDIDKINFDSITDDFSVWGQIAESSTANSYLSISQENTHDRISIRHLSSDPVERYEITYFEKSEENKKPDVPLAWTVLSKDLVPESIKKFIRFHYVASMSLPVDNYIGYQPFNIKTNCWWGTQNVENYQDKKYPLVIDARSFNIVNGQVIFKPFNIEIISEEQFMLFFDIYLLASDFSIKKISGDKNNTLDANKPIQMEFSENDLIEQVMSGEVYLQVKIFLSRDPITIDFSQTR